MGWEGAPQGATPPAPLSSAASLPAVPPFLSAAPLRAWRWHGRGGFHVLELSGSMCRRPWGGQGFPGSPAVRRAGGVPESDGFPAVPAASPGLASPLKRVAPCSAPAVPAGDLAHGATSCAAGGDKGPERFRAPLGTR